MAIGDSFSIMIGTGANNRQPADGVFEELSSLVKFGTTDAPVMYDGSTAVNIMQPAIISGETTNNSDAGAPGTNYSNMAIKIGYVVYIRKEGSTDTFCFTGVQVDA